MKIRLLGRCLGVGAGLGGHRTDIGSGRSGGAGACGDIVSEVLVALPVVAVLDEPAGTLVEVSDPVLSTDIASALTSSAATVGFGCRRRTMLRRARHRRLTGPLVALLVFKGRADPGPSGRSHGSCSLTGVARDCASSRGDA